MNLNTKNLREVLDRLIASEPTDWLLLEDDQKENAVRIILSGTIHPGESTLCLLRSIGSQTEESVRNGKLLFYVGANIVEPEKLN